MELPESPGGSGEAAGRPGKEAAGASYEPFAAGRRETEKERLDRNLVELLTELRVALPGVQVLFAFLLTVPFTQRFADLTNYQEGVYYGTLLLAAAAVLLMIAPTAHHRILFRREFKGHIVFVANRLAIAGSVCLALAMTGVVLLITDLLFGSPASAIAFAVSLLAFGGLWYALPLTWRLRHR